MQPFVPFSQGALRSSARLPLGVYGNIIEYNTPYSRYLYYGEKYGPNIPKYDKDGNLIGFYSPKKKHPTGEPLHYHTAGTGDHWFEKAKQAHYNEWLMLVKDELLRR